MHKSMVYSEITKINIINLNKGKENEKENRGRLRINKLIHQ